MSVNSALTATAPVRQQLPVPQFFSFNQRMPLPGGPTSASGPTRKRSDLGLLSWCLQVGPDEVRSSHFGEKLEALRSAQGGWLSPPLGPFQAPESPGLPLRGTRYKSHGARRPLRRPAHVVALQAAALSLYPCKSPPWLPGPPRGKGPRATAWICLDS